MTERITDERLRELRDVKPQYVRDEHIHPICAGNTSIPVVPLADFLRAIEAGESAMRELDRLQSALANKNAVDNLPNGNLPSGDI